jgi:medium-chain acyl-[acyl-carrier-protein] hydrolase
LDVPFTLFGHSLGALIAFELVREFRRSGRPSPALLVASGCRAPQVPDLAPPVHGLPDAEFVAELRKLNGIPETISQNSEYLGLIVPTLRADLTLYENYVYNQEEPLPCPIVAFAGVDDSKAPAPAVAAWAAQTQAAFSLRVFPGDHFFLSSAQGDLLRAVADLLAELRR